MSIRLLTTREPLLKAGQYLGFVGRWDPPYLGPEDGRRPGYFQVDLADPRWRRFRWGIMNTASASLPYTISPDASGAGNMGLNPRQTDTIYETRWGIPPGILMYIQWPKGQYRGGLQEPLYQTPLPAGNDQRYIAPWTYQESPVTDPRLEIFLIRDTIPDLVMQQNSGQNYVKVVFAILVNLLRIHVVEDPDTIDKLNRGIQPYRRLFSSSYYTT